MILVADELEEDSDLWALPQGVAVERPAEILAAAVSTMLCSAQVILFVDPYFAPQRDRYRRTLKAFLRACLERRAVDQPSRIRVVSSDDTTNGTPQYFMGQCRSRLPREVPAGLQLTICRLHQRPSAEKLHNRYILTDLGGAMFGVGLDEGESGDTEDIQLLDRKQYEERWQQYAGINLAFDQLEPDIIVVGSA